jgi:ComF family protein
MLKILYHKMSDIMCLSVGFSFHNNMLRLITKIKVSILSLINDFISLVFPHICAACGDSLLKQEETICLSCEFHLPRTNFHLIPENPVSRLFWGKVTLESAAAYLYFNKGNKVQVLIHKLKYQGRKDIGVCLGRQYGQYLKVSSFFQTVQLIIPVPLHKKKLKQRGYNQSEQFAIGLGESMILPVLADVLYRRKETETQTKKSRFQRWQNVDDVFDVNDPELLELKHVLLVDDVITTGATLESCIHTLSSIRGIRISVATIAVATT